MSCHCRRNRVTPGPNLPWPVNAIVMVVVGVIVLAACGSMGIGALIVGAGMIAAGVYVGVMTPQGSSATERTDEHPTAP